VCSAAAVRKENFSSSQTDLSVILQVTADDEATTSWHSGRKEKLLLCAAKCEPLLWYLLRFPFCEISVTQETFSVSIFTNLGKFGLQIAIKSKISLALSAKVEDQSISY
jgi:hypothetical protein